MQNDLTIPVSFSTNYLDPFPTLTSASLKRAYQSMRKGNKLEENPLLRLELFRRHVLLFNKDSCGAFSQIAVEDFLIEILIETLGKLRATHRLPPLDWTLAANEAMIDLIHTAQTNNKFLIGASVIFYRYARYDLDWQVGQIAHHLGQSRRTTQRNANDFLRFLTQSLLRREIEIWTSISQE